MYFLPTYMHIKSYHLFDSTEDSEMDCLTQRHSEDNPAIVLFQQPESFFFLSFCSVESCLAGSTTKGG